MKYQNHSKDKMTNNNEQLIIEFIGLPGAGKTTIGNALIERVAKDAEFSVFNASAKRIDWLKKSREKRSFSLAASISGQSKLLFVRCLCAGLRLKPFFLKSLHLMATYPQFDMISSIKTQDHVILFDQGPLQYLCSATFQSYRSDDKCVLNILRQSRAVPKIIVHITCPRQLSYNRVCGRPENDSRFDRYNEIQFFEMIKLYDQRLNEITHIYSEHSDVEIITVSAENNITENTETIYSHIKKIIESQTRES